MSADAASLPRLAPAWTYGPGPDVAFDPPPGLRAVQALARAGAMAGLAAGKPGVTERGVERAVGERLIEGGAVGIWTITNVGLGDNAKVCFPTNPPTDLKAEQRDVLMVDVHPISQAGFWGDCTRCLVIGDFPEAQQALCDLEKLHYETIGKCRPGMPANELFSMSHERLSAEGFVLLDKLANIGHSLAPGAAYLDKFIDATNETPMWAAWALEPFAQRGDVAVKVEDLVWFGREKCQIV